MLRWLGELISHIRQSGRLHLFLKLILVLVVHFLTDFAFDILSDYVDHRGSEETMHVFALRWHRFLLNHILR